ncbi:O-linked N-acetylglucosamine transferase, SPINDLY family protein [Methylobacterium sp. ID0610]|uniref:O-linked N-acetylglucosamine transferase, SPINDLY family protein n=1 Tax=Methylobacterium carpenticola TaxID=3344827 RepID=UPI0036B52B49
MLTGQVDTGTVEALFTDGLERARTQKLDLAQLIGLGDALKAQGATAKAADLYKLWIACNAGHPLLYAVYFNYGTMLGELSDQAGAANALREATRLKPDFMPAAINLGNALERLGQTGAAVLAWTEMTNQLAAVTGEAVGFKLTGLKQIGRVLEAAQNDTLAEDHLWHVLDLDPRQSDAIQHWIALRLRQCKWPILAESGQVTRRHLLSEMSSLSAACFTDDPIYQLALAHHYCKTTTGLWPKPEEALPPLDLRNRRPGPLRIGYVSSDLREHAVGFGMAEVLELHDRSRCEVFIYYCGIATTDATHRRAQAAADHWRDLTGVGDAAAARLIRADAIDILVDLNGYTKDARARVFAMRPAPVNVNWFGFPGSMGTPYHHYIIADDTILPRDYEGIVSEAVLRLPCYQPNDRRRPVAEHRPTRREVGLPEQGFVFGSLNGVQKITPRVFSQWMTILANVPGSVLWLLTGAAEANERLRQEAAAQGIAPERLVFAAKEPNPRHLARSALPDLFLDSFPYGAHTSAADALWMGVPVLTRPGRSFAARVCSSLVRAAGIPEMICTSAEDYVQRAIAYGRNPETLAPIKQRLTANRSTCELFDTPLLVRRLEGLYQQMAEAAASDALPVPNLRALDYCHEIATSLDLETVDTLSDEEYRALYRERLAAYAEVYGREAAMREFL